MASRDKVPGWDRVGNLKPTRQRLQAYVIPRVATDWYGVGVQLCKDRDVPQLNTIQNQYPSNFTRACTEMFEYWLRRYPNATWNKLVNALRAPGLELNAFAFEIMKDVVKASAEDDSDDDSGPPGAPAVNIFSEKPHMLELKQIVIPEVKAHWEDLAYSMGYEIADVDAIDRDGSNVGDRCTELFEDWLTAPRGYTPKTWGKLIEAIRRVEDLYVAAERITKKLTSESKPSATDKSINKQKLEILQSISKSKEDNCTIEVRYGKVLMCGAGAAGKTNFLNLLMEEDFEQDHISTALTKHQQVAIKVQPLENSNSKIYFKKMDVDAEIDLLWQYLPEKYTTLSIQKATRDEEQNDAFESKLQVTCTTVEDTMAYKIASNTIGKNKPHKNPVVKSSKKVWDVLTFVDTGGQPQFISMLPAVNNFAMVTFIVHKMIGGNDSLAEKVVVIHNSEKQGTLEYTYYDLIKTLMSYASSILLPNTEFLKDKSSTSDKDKNLSEEVKIPKSLKLYASNILLPIKKIFKGKSSCTSDEDKKGTLNKEKKLSSISFVGTHSSKVLQQNIKEIDDELIKIITLSGAKNIRPSLNSNYEYLVPLDSKVQEKNSAVVDENDVIYTDPSKLRNYIHEWLKEQEVYSVPIQWLLLELEIRKVCNADSRNFMMYEEVLKLGRDKNLGKDDFIKNGLRFHHLFGVLLFFEIKGMPELIITNHQWLFDKLTDIVRYSFKANCNSNEELEKYRKGIVDEVLLDKLKISKDFENSGIEKNFDKPKKYFLELLQHLRIIASSKQDSTQYFMPSLLKSCGLTNVRGKIPGKKSFQIKSIESMNLEPLLIQFSKSYDSTSLFPRGIFCFLVVQLMNCTDWVSYGQAYGNMISFDKQDTLHYVTLIDHIFFLEIHVRPYESDYEPTNNNVFITVKDIILDALSEVGDRLNISVEVECGFQCTKCKESHISVCTKNPECFFCVNGQPTRLKESHKIWLEKLKDSSMKKHSAKGQSEKPRHQSMDSNSTKLYIWICCAIIVALVAVITVHFFTKNDDDSGSKDTLVVDIINGKPEMADLNKIVVKKVMIQWEQLADGFRYDGAIIAKIKIQNRENPEECCRAFLRDWLVTDNGINAGPKTWSTLFDIIKEYTSIASEIREDMIKQVKKLK